MIASMLLLINKKANNLGYKTAKRRIAMELRDMITAILIEFQEAADRIKEALA